MLKISNLEVRIKNKIVLNNINLNIKKGEIHAVMGPNGAGKSTLAQVIGGNEHYNISNGRIQFHEKDLLTLTVDERARKGIFIGFQYPIEIPGVSWLNFLKASINAMRKEQHLDEISYSQYLKNVKEKARLLSIDESFLQRPVNEGFSGGEKKKFEVLQILLLSPQLIILDELDSGLDIDALKTVTNILIKYYNKTKSSILIITHYRKFLHYIKPDFVHIFCDGALAKTGDLSLAAKIENYGYQQFLMCTK